jgi:hypothetical protein
MNARKATRGIECPIFEQYPALMPLAGLTEMIFSIKSRSVKKSVKKMLHTERKEISVNYILYTVPKDFCVEDHSRLNG